MIARLTRKRTVLLLVLLGAAVLLVSGSRVWVEGRVDDPVLGASVLHGTGSKLARGVLAAALVGAAAAVAAATAGRAVRVVAAVATVVAALLGAVVVVRLLTDPSTALGELAATSTGRTGRIHATGSTTVWPWIALVACVAMGLGGVAALVGGGRWRGLSSAYDAPVAAAGGGAGGGGAADQTDRVQPQARPVSAWEQLSQGEDPTAPEGREDA